MSRTQSYTYHASRLEELLAGSPYQTYVYSYPHKTAYRPLETPQPLEQLWAAEQRQALFLYLHIPFCEMRCGFCNLFTTVRPADELVAAYLDTLERQAHLVRSLLGPLTIARFAIGGGTPTYLSLQGLERILNIAEHIMGADLQRIPISVEVSPETATPAKLRLLRQRGVKRISIGIQSFLDSEVAAVHRRQQATQVETALDHIRAAGFPTLNLDLMYGLPDQTVPSWLASLRAALRYQPEEIFLYPLYVRPITRLGTSDQEWDDIRLACYRAARDFLLAEGYQQRSMRLFHAPHAPTTDGPAYCCQQDGMLGLGCGARSYTDTLHYSSNYAVGPQHVTHILRAFVASPDSTFTHASYGFPLNPEERRRRHILLSLLSHEGLDQTAYHHRFGTLPLSDLPELSDLLPLGLAAWQANTLHLTPAGRERSDTIGPWLFSETVRQRISKFDLT
jgi:oxygen-independent coproporphyrinogen-3 oxidase